MASGKNDYWDLTKGVSGVLSSTNMCRQPWAYGASQSKVLSKRQLDCLPKKGAQRCQLLNNGAEAV